LPYLREPLNQPIWLQHLSVIEIREDSRMLKQKNGLKKRKKFGRMNGAFKGDYDSKQNGKTDSNAL